MKTFYLLLLTFLLTSCKREQYILKGRFIEGTYMDGWEGMHFEVWPYKDPNGQIGERLGTFVTDKDGYFTFLYEHQRGIKYFELWANNEPGYKFNSSEEYARVPNVGARTWVVANQNKDITLYAAKQGKVKIYLKEKEPLKEGDTLFIKVGGFNPYAQNPTQYWEKEYVLPKPSQGLLDSLTFTVKVMDYMWARNRVDYVSIMNYGPPYKQQKGIFPKGDPFVHEVTIEY